MAPADLIYLPARFTPVRGKALCFLAGRPYESSRQAGLNKFQDFLPFVSS